MHRLVERCRPLFQNPSFRVIFLLNVLLGLGYSFITPFFSMFGTLEVKMNPMLFGVFMTSLAIGGVFFGTVLAHYSDLRYSRRSMLILGSVAGAAGYVSFAFIRDFTPLILIGTLVLGVSSITFSQVFALAREWLGRSGIPKTETAFYMNAFRMFFALAWTVGPAVASWIMVAYSYRGLFFGAATCFLALLAVVLRFVPANTPAGAGSATSVNSSLRNVLRRFDVLAHFIGFVLVFASGTIGMMNLPLMVLKTLGGTERHVGVVYSVAPVFELPFMLYFGMLATKVDPAKIIRVGVLIAIVYYALLTLVQAPWHVYPLQILSAATVAVTSGVAITYFQNYLPHHPGTATNLYATAQRIGSTVGYLLFGTLDWRFGHRAVFVACALFTTISLGLVFVPSKPDTEG
ncbi:MFS transporter [Opitutaceae bacterium EW11]|nr:MFS transporter [Opitutaceae bacterium EW11]